MEQTFGKVVRGWFLMARVPFHSVGVLPFILGTVLAAQWISSISWPVFWLGAGAVILIMLATYLNGEYYDIIEDGISWEMGKSAFAGGSGAIPRRLVPRRQAFNGALAAAAGAMAIGLLLVLVCGTGRWTIPLGIAGLLAGYFYSAPPIRWVERGVGELLIGFCYGWLPIATGFYLQRGSLDGLNHWLSLPIGLSIFNVILINEFPDWVGDTAAGKLNLTVRLGRERAAVIYIAATMLEWLFTVLSVNAGAPRRILLFYLPVAVVSMVTAGLVAARKYENRNVLETICGLTIVVNLGTTLAYIVGTVWREY